MLVFRRLYLKTVVPYVGGGSGDSDLQPAIAHDMVPKPAVKVQFKT